MKILILTIGTLGDVQPYVALGRALKNSGHEVIISTCAHFESFIRENGLEYAWVNNDFIEFMHSPEGKIILGNAGNFWDLLKTVIPLLSKLGDLQERQMTDVWSACRDTLPDLIIYHPKAIGAPDFAEKLGVPCMQAFWLPIYAPTTRFPAMGFPDLPLGPKYNWFTYKFIRRMLIMLSKRVRKWRKQNGLPARSHGFRMQLPNGRPIPVLHGFSRHIIPQPDDWPESSIVTGYWFLNQDEKWVPPPDLAAFLSAGEPPVYFGFGSIFGRDPKRVTRIVMEAIRRTGIRAIIARGWGGLQPEESDASDSVMLIDSVPHDWLFPRVRAVVHHGGCGTTAAGLLAGKPGIICPFFGDQPFWGKHVARLGVGPTPIPQNKLTIESLCHAINAVIDNSEMEETAAALGRRLQKEDGTANAVSFITQWMNDR